MSVERDASQYLPKYFSGRSDLRTAFLYQDSLFPAIGFTKEEMDALPLHTLREAGGNYFSAAVSALVMQEQSRFMRSIGKTSYRKIGSKQVEIVATNDTQGAALVYGVHPEIVYRRVVPGHPFAELSTLLEKDTKTKGGRVTLDFSFIAMARTAPVEALAQTVWICSQIYDASNGRFRKDTEDIIHARANAREAQFMREVQARYPQLLLSEYYLDLLASSPPEDYRQLEYI